MDETKHKNTYFDTVNTASEQELNEKLLNSWQLLDDRDIDDNQDVLERIKVRIDSVIDTHEKKHMRSVSRWHVWGKIAAVLVPLLMIGATIMFFIPSGFDLTEEHCLYVVTANNERATVILPDGTDVVLNSDTRLSYNPGFTRDSIRLVSLIGEAYFKVAKDATRPFVVSLDNIRIKVLGTSFNVRNIIDDFDVEIALVEGAVELIAPGEQVFLREGNVATYDSYSNTFAVADRGCHLATGWLRHEKTYINVSPDSLVRMLEQEYEITLTAEAKAHIDDSFTGTFPDNNIDETLAILSEIYNFDMKSAALKSRQVD